MSKKAGQRTQRPSQVAAARESVDGTPRADHHGRRRALGAAALGVALLVAVIGWAVNIHTSGNAAASTAASTPATPLTTASGRDTAPPWPAPTNAAAAVKAAGLPMLSTEGTVEHIHVHLDVLVNGQPVRVPQGIGIDNNAATISALHTHDTTGVVHVESPAKDDFTLGQFFTEWQVALTGAGIGGLQANGTEQFHAYVNGIAYTGDPAAIVLHDHDEIALVYGTATEQRSAPTSYAFPAGG